MIRLKAEVRQRQKNQQLSEFVGQVCNADLAKATFSSVPKAPDAPCDVASFNLSQ